jgi:hypothetical protein
MYFPDMGTSTQIAEGPHVRAIGWLDASHPFPTGALSRVTVDCIRSYAKHWGQSIRALDWPVFAGPHKCDFCSAFWASGNFGVPTGDVLFVCPEMIAHYVAAHHYMPPGAFVDAVESAPLPGSEAYQVLVTPFRKPRAP